MATVERPIIEIPDLGEAKDRDGPPWLENGERMDSATFLERYEQTPDGFRAELVEGIVYVMASPLQKRHGRGGNRARGWLFNYSLATPGTEAQDDATTVLGGQSAPQPDSALLILPEYGGQCRDTEDEKYTLGAPELLVEVAQSSRSIDLNAKFRDYQRAGVLEYIVYDLRDQVVRWFVLQEGAFVPLPPDADGLIRSRAFPGLWLDPAALLRNDKPALIAALNRGLATPEHAAFLAELERRRAALATPPAEPQRDA